MHPISMTIHIFPSRNVNVLEYRVPPQTLLRVLLTIQFMYLNMFQMWKFLNLKTHLAQEGLNMGFLTSIMFFGLFFKYRN